MMLFGQALLILIDLKFEYIPVLVFYPLVPKFTFLFIPFLSCGKVQLSAMELIFFCFEMLAWLTGKSLLSFFSNAIKKILKAQ
jgi:hypothetical protein